MALVHGGSLLRRWTRKVTMTACCLVVASCIQVSAQNLPQPPANSDLAFRIVPSQYGAMEMSADTLKEQPLLRLAAQATVEYLGFDMVEGLHEAFEGTVVGAVLSEPKKGSSLVAYFVDQDLRSRRELIVEEMRSLASDIEAYKTENETYPADFRKFIDEYRYYEPYLSDGASYEYQPTADGFRLVVSYDPTSPMAALGPAPVFSAGGEEQNVVPKAKGPRLNYVVGAKVADAGMVKSMATSLMGEPRDGFWISSPSDPPVVATLRGPWLVVSDDKSNISPFLKALNGQAPGLSKNPGFQTVARNIDTNAPAMMYADMPRILKSAPGVESPEFLRLLRMVGPVGYAITPYERAQTRIEVFMGLTPPKDSQLAAVLAESAEGKPEAAMVANNIPWDVSNAFAVDYRRGKRLFDAVVALSDEAKEGLDVAEDVWAGFLGLDAERGFDGIADGWVIVSFERLDIFVSAFEGFFETMAAFDTPPEMPGGTGGPDGDLVEPVVPSDEQGDDGAVPEDGESVSVEVVVEENVAQPADPEPAGEEPPSDEPVMEVEESVEVEMEPVGPSAPPRLPFTVAFQVTDDQARTALLEALTGQMGDDVTTSEMFGVPVTGRKDGLLSYAQRDQWFYLSGGHTQRLMRNLLAAATGHKESLTRLDTWAQFRAGQRGEVIAIGHQKLDGAYALVKAFLLFMGPEFRPLAYELGGLRDYHSAAFVVPDGLLMVGDVLQGDGR